MAIRSNVKRVRKTAGALGLGLMLAAATASAQTTITFMGAWGTAPRMKVVDDLIAQFEKAHPDIKVNVIQPAGGWSGVEEKAQVMIASGTPPDLLYMGETGGYAAFAEAGLLAPLDPLIKASGLDTSDFFPGLLAEGRFGGTQYLLPIDSITDIYAYNMDLLQNAGLDRPAQTQSELVTYAQKLRGGADQAGATNAPVGIYAPWIFQGLSDLLYPNGGSFVSADGQPDLNSRPVFDALQFALDQVKAGNFQLGAGGWEQGKTPIIAAQPINMSRTLAAKVPFEVQTDLVPAGTAGHVNWGLGHFFAIPAASHNQQAAWQLAQFLLSGQPDVEWHVQMNFLPTRFSVIRGSDYYQKEPIWHTFLVDLQSAKPLPVTGWYVKVAKVYGQQVQAAFNGKASLTQALDGAQQQAEGIVADVNKGA